MTLQRALISLGLSVGCLIVLLVGPHLGLKLDPSIQERLTELFMLSTVGLGGLIAPQPSNDK